MRRSVAFARIALVAAVLSPAATARGQLARAAAATTLPNVVGKNLDSAVNALAWTKLVIVQIELVTTKAPRGTVVAQKPPGGTPLRNTKVDTLVWAAAPARVPVDAVVHRSIVGVVAPAASTTPATAPPAPTARDSLRGTAVSVVVSGLSSRLPGVVVRDDTYIPQLVGRNSQMVAALLKGARLKPGVVARDYSEDIAAGLVFRQHPEYSRIPVAAGTSVDVWYSLGRPPPTAQSIKVPSVVGLDLSHAAIVLKRSGLRFGHVDTLWVNGGVGTIAHQRPDSGLGARVGDAVDVSLAILPRALIVPDVTGITRDSAEQVLKMRGLGVGRVTLVSVAGRDTTIVSQSPAARAEVPPGSLVDLVENRPPVARRVAVPPLAGLTREDATRVLARDSLFLGEVLVVGDSSGRVVVAQDPKEGSSVFSYSAVNVTMQGSSPAAADSQFVRVPSVVNTTAELARLTLADSGFTNVSVVGDSATAAGIVTSQSPRAGTLASPASTVALTLAAAAGPPVPSLIGMSEAAARSEAGNHGMLMTVAARHRAMRLSDAVVRQSPSPPSIGPADNTIVVDLAVPVVPPLPTAIVLAAAGIAATVGRKLNLNGRPDPPTPTPPAGVRLIPVAKTPPRASLTTDVPSLIRHSVAMRYAATARAWRLQPDDRSLIKPKRSSDA